MSDKIAKAVETYISAFNNKDYEAIVNLYTDDATVEDPVGTPLKKGRADIEAFYKGAVQGGSKLTQQGPTRIAGNNAEAAFAFQVAVGTMTIDVIDAMTFNEAGQVTSMRAFWSPSNITHN